MTEAEWLSGRDPEAMADIIREWVSLRKMMLVRAVEFRRNRSGLVRPALVELEEASRDLVCLFADGNSDTQALFALINRRNAALMMFIESQDFEGAAYNRDRVDFLAALSRPEEVRRRFRVLPDDVPVVWDVFGNPFRPVARGKDWCSGTAIALATTIYDTEAFDRLPILADALEDAGCDDADVLSHCRQPGPHVRGCWVVDLVLGKE